MNMDADQGSAGSWQSSRLVQLLAEKYGITDIDKHGRTKCPRCGGHNLTIKRNGEIAKCWNCQLVLFHDEQPPAPDRTTGVVSDLFRSMMVDWHKTLINQPLNPPNNSNALSYLIARGINMATITAVETLGVVPPGSDTDYWDRWTHAFSAVDTELQTKAAIEETDFPQSKRRAPGYTEYARKRLKWWLRLRDAVIYKVTAVPQNNQQRADHARRAYPPKPKFGQLVYWFTDSRLRATGIKFRVASINVKLFDQVWLNKRSRGLFGVGLYSSLHNDADDNLIVVEGEMNLLRLQSLMNSAGLSWVHMCAVGSSGSADVDAVYNEGGNIYVCYDHDKPTTQYPRGAGWKVVSDLASVRAVRAFTTPKLGSDIDSFISDAVAAGKTPREIINEIKDLISSCIIVNKDLDKVRQEISDWRSGIDRRGNKKVQRWRARIKACDVVIRDMNERGKFYRNGSGRAWYFEFKTKRLFEIDEGCHELITILKRYDISRGDEIYTQMNGRLIAYALGEGEIVEPRKFSWFNIKDKMPSVYIYDGGSVIIVTRDAIKIADNGVDGVLFEHNYASDAVGLTIGDINAAGKVCEPVTFRKVVTDGMSFSAMNLMSPIELSFIMESWFLAMFFGGMTRAKPIMAMIGEPGSGKTMALAKILWLLNGNTGALEAMAGKQRDFDTSIMRAAPMLAFDNVDGKQPDWLADRLASIATGATVTMRKLFTTNSIIRFQPQLWLGVTANTPWVFRRADLADRLIIVKFQKHRKNTISERMIEDQVKAARRRVWAESVVLIRKILMEMYTPALERKEMKVGLPNDYRMTTFRDFVLNVATVAGRYNEFSGLFGRVGMVQRQFVVSNDPYLDLLQEWSALRDDTSLYMNGELWNTGKVIASGINETADKNNIRFRRPLTARGFTTWASRNENLLRHMLEMKTRKRTGYPIEYQFSPKPPPEIDGTEIEKDEKGALLWRQRWNETGADVNE